MLRIGKTVDYNNGSYFYTKYKNHTLYRIHMNGIHSCWIMDLNEKYEDIENNKRIDRDISIDSYPEWIWNGVHYSRNELDRSFDVVLHIDGIEWDANGTLMASDHGFNDVIDVYNQCKKQYLMGWYKYPPIITLD